MLGLKDVENRSRRTHFRGRIAIHVNGKPAEMTDDDFDALPPPARRVAREAWSGNVLTGHVIGTVEVVDCIADSTSPWARSGMWHWLLRNPRRYARPVPATGQL